MHWLQLRLNTSQQYADIVGDEMMALGALSVTMMDAKDDPILEPAPGETPLWEEIAMMLLFDASIGTKDFLDAWKNNAHSAHTSAEVFELLEDKDWEREWMDLFQPMQFGKRLWVCPSWKAIPDESAVNVMLDPGLAFGTGTHPTTALCLTWLDGEDLEGKTLIDYGCGSGILAIAALKLGASKVYAVDIDPQAIIATTENAKRNNVLDDRLMIGYPKDIKGVIVDNVVANILSGPLVELVNEIADHCKIGGKIALSGILETQAVTTREAYTSWFEMAEPVYQQDWSRLNGLKIK
ncbi:MAG: 50S ribosomal protein L11 methyltransferase [Marinobacter sp.]|nr:MAG: 50S ribosomal protein L11 methyltransferase [Marinobacter sp.]